MDQLLQATVDEVSVAGNSSIVGVMLKVLLHAMATFARENRRSRALHLLALLLN